MSLTVEKCLQAWTNSIRQMNAKADIVFFGDSLTYYGDFSSVFPDKIVCNLGLRGDTIQGMIDRVEQVGMLEPDVLYLMAGINDVARCTLGKFESLYELLISELKRTLPNTEIILQTILPVNDVDFSISCNNEQIIVFNKAISSLANMHGFRLIDLFSNYANNGEMPKQLTKDGIHLQKDAYERWYSVLKL